MSPLRPIALLALAALLSGCPDTGNNPSAVTRLSTEDDERLVATVTRRDIDESVDATGFVESLHAPFDIRAEIGGKVKNIFVENGDKVLRGDKLVEIDDTSPREDFMEASRNAQLAKLELERAERDYQRQESLFNEGFSTEKARLDAKTEVDFARLRLEVAEARVDKARNQLAKTVVTAPFDGFISDLNIVPEQLVGTGGTLMRVYDFNRLRVVAKFNEYDAARMTLGKEGVVSFDSLPGVSAPGKIGYISPFASLDQNLRVFTAKIDFSPEDAPVRPGVSANVKIITRSAKDALSVPISAVFIDGPERIVYVKKSDGDTERRPVRTGLNDNVYVEIREGLSLDEKVSLVRPR